jgi:hypothetical protein
MMAHPRTLALFVIAAALLPAAAQAYWVDPCGCTPAPLYSYYHHYHHRYAGDRYVAVELAPNTFAIPYRLRNYPYVNCLDGCGDRYVDRTATVREPAVVIEDGTRRGGSTSRTIKADAEVTILGPDRMNIRLFRKGRGKTINPGD